MKGLWLLRISLGNIFNVLKMDIAGLWNLVGYTSAGNNYSDLRTIR